ncbi:uncharacterized protein FOMMEDRAFT_152335 [Fomitiporia mediterranea MF3/22]|uniref:uncharacterized protein n=1 Tax=Fomitiporia mediterranea (strain MF3/22) TaxID=694068 RepID=UPI00044089CF|nr:uncharacterized protein FOMMEDRAFT_152335 [Fomitiporia mediterranea MF3/22]EJD06994.1 hypothetical protein FOMMEDRAFT_152335 [Fomitiporia mediterranea MF3/22]
MLLYDLFTDNWIRDIFTFIVIAYIAGQVQLFHPSLPDNLSTAVPVEDLVSARTHLAVAYYWFTGDASMRANACTVDSGSSGACERAANEECGEGQSDRAHSLDIYVGASSQDPTAIRQWQMPPSLPMCTPGGQTKSHLKIKDDWAGGAEVVVVSAGAAPTRLAAKATTATAIEEARMFT